ncbi:CynX/NimT family MFS transporter [Paeniglutamicibacter sp. MACA_103]|uniref:CynX/NimT family MFS transporter n=1 Tax=Paeniglutamicibacter sp. MACA_103 TaxID=3377337 RepID=UPI0038950057
MLLPPATAAEPPAFDQNRDRAWITIVLVAVVAATHIWKLPSALTIIDAELQLGLVRSGVLLGIIQVASMAGGLLVAWFGEMLGLRRLLMTGLTLLAIGSLFGALAPGVVVLMVSRALEGIGFLLCTVLAPPLIRRCCSPERMNIAMAGWGAFQGTAALIGFAGSALLLQVIDWRVLWLGVAILSLGMLLPLKRLVPADQAAAGDGSATASGRRIWITVRSVAPWIAGLAFACYSIQWMAVMGFLPTIYQGAGMDPLRAGLLSALVGGVNVIGALYAGVLIERGRRPRTLLVVCFTVMAFASIGLFGIRWTSDSGTAARLGFALVFSSVGGMGPTVLSRVAVDLAPPGGSVAAVIGLMQQIFNVGNFFGPFLIAWIAMQAGGWHASWLMMCAFSVLGIVFTWILTNHRAPREPIRTASTSHASEELD